MTLSVPALNVTSTSFCQMLCNHFLLATLTTVPWIRLVLLPSFMALANRRGRGWNIPSCLWCYRDFSRSPTCVDTLLDRHCYSGTKVAGSVLQCSGRESGGPGLGSGDSLFGILSCEEVTAAPLTPCLLYFSSSPLTWTDTFMCLLAVPSPH